MEIEAAAVATVAALVVAKAREAEMVPVARAKVAVAEMGTVAAAVMGRVRTVAVF